ncbi:MAG: alpha/beta fold hydrolase [Desulfuromonadaceae bacterium]|jgi:carboxylesterase
MIAFRPKKRWFRRSVDVPVAKPYEGAALNKYPDNLPFLLEPKTPPQAAVLLVHGFTATPWEMRPIAEVLHAAGYATMGICLPGHGTLPEHLSTRRYEEWLHEVDRGYQQLSRNYPQVYGVGMSTGAMLLLALARNRPIQGLVLFSPFLRLRHVLAPLVGFLRHIKPYQKRKLPDHLANRYYHRRPLNGVYQIQRLIRDLEKDLKSISTPTLIFTGQGDRTIALGSAKRLFRELGSTHKRHHQFGPEVSHVIAIRESPRWEETVEQTLHFLRMLGEMAGSSTGAGRTGL